MEKIEILLEKLNNRITASLGKRIDTLDDLNEKLEVCGEDYEKNPTDANRDNYNEVIEYVEKIELGIIADLEALLNKRKSEELAKQKLARATPQPTQRVTPQPTQRTTPPSTPPAIEEDKVKKEGSGVLTFVIGSVLLVASLGAINYFRKQ